MFHTALTLNVFLNQLTDNNRRNVAVTVFMGKELPKTAYTIYDNIEKLCAATYRKNKSLYEMSNRFVKTVKKEKSDNEHELCAVLISHREEIYVVSVLGASDGVDNFGRAICVARSRRDSDGRVKFDKPTARAKIFHSNEVAKSKKTGRAGGCQQLSISFFTSRSGCRTDGALEFLADGRASSVEEENAALKIENADLREKIVTQEFEFRQMFAEMQRMNAELMERMAALEAKVSGVNVPAEPVVEQKPEPRNEYNLTPEENDIIDQYLSDLL